MKEMVEHKESNVNLADKVLNELSNNDEDVLNIRWPSHWY